MTGLGSLVARHLATRSFTWRLRRDFGLIAKNVCWFSPIANIFYMIGAFDGPPVDITVFVLAVRCPGTLDAKRERFKKGEIGLLILFRKTDRGLLGL